ncbi:uncharacterized protein B0T15DRAFT_571854 [Chaetomium strumarium]|uniref:Aminoglycoside phosphotransferase domain-containing protein n=1 Tax=Chaetomium strumarium TaxID=1170767 RepID=A0AAJ0H483_9PEZI|nr:hypothetical protein B0T15DRAFT_571854 [Chaetomium strumarium]
MALLYGDLDDEIDYIFSQASAPRAECDDWARTICTVVAGLNREKIVQFRNMNVQLDMRMLDLARQIHGKVVPVGAALGQIGDDGQRQLAIYEMDRLPGDNYAMVRTSLAEVPQSQLAAVHSLARFFAQAWRRPVALDRDLNELNILVDGRSGIITRVIDWTDAGIQPFGLTLYALEKFIGSMGRDGWVFFDNAGALRDEFWRAFTLYPGQVSYSQMRIIQAARKAGYLLRYGTFYSTGQKGVVGIENMSIEKRRLYLQAIL